MKLYEEEKTKNPDLKPNLMSLSGKQGKPILQQLNDTQDENKNLKATIQVCSCTINHVFLSPLFSSGSLALPIDPLHVLTWFSPTRLKALTSQLTAAQEAAAKAGVSLPPPPAAVQEAAAKAGISLVPPTGAPASMPPLPGGTTPASAMPQGKMPPLPGKMAPAGGGGGGDGPGQVSPPRDGALGLAPMGGGHVSPQLVAASAAASTPDPMVAKLKEQLKDKTKELMTVKKELTAKVGETTQYQNLRKMMMKKTEELKKFKVEMEKYDPGFGKDQDDDEVVDDDK